MFRPLMDIIAGTYWSRSQSVGFIFVYFLGDVYIYECLNVGGYLIKPLLKLGIGEELYLTLFNNLFLYPCSNPDANLCYNARK